LDEKRTMDATVIMVPQTDLGAAYRAQKGEIDAAISRVLESGRFLLGNECVAFEREFAGWLGAPQAVGCATGTDALALLLRGLGIGPASSVVTVSHTSVADVAAVEMCGAVPILIDIERDHYTMDATDLEAVLATPRRDGPPIRAVIAVHLYGQAADMTRLISLCARHDVALIEDCSQAHGACYQGRKVGTLAEGAAFSLYPTKNLGALGDGGVVATRDAGLSERIAALRQYGWRSRNISDEVGINSRLDEIQAAILRVRLDRLDAGNARRRLIAAAYDEALAGSSVHPPARRPGTEHVFHQYVIRLADRAGAQSHFRALGVGTAVHYPVPVHRQAAYSGRVALGPSGCRNSDRVAGQVLSLPIFPELTDGQVEHVCDALRGV
jgi:dTDP-4-amino-4,6-dideoxygalactose transaminase